MIKKIAQTIVTRVLTLLGAFAIVVLNAQYLGSHGQGDIALINLGILLIISISNFIGGGAASYLVPRIGATRLLLPSYAWALLSAGGFFLIFKLYPILPEQYIVAVTILAFMHSLFSFHMGILIGEEKIKEYNILQIIQIFGLLFCLLFFYKIRHQVEVWTFIRSSFISFSGVLLVSIFFIRQHYREVELKSFRSSFLDLFKYGKYAQLSNVFQLLNYRLNLLMIEFLLPMSRSLVGIYSVGMNVSDAVLNFGRSLSLVQYSKILNRGDEEQKNVLMTTLFFKLSIGITFILILVINFLPEGFYLFIFGKSFAGIKGVIRYMSLGVLALSGSTIFAHYLSGKGLYKYNTVGSAIALIGTVFVGYFLIKGLQLKGAALSFSIAMVLQLAYLTHLFLKIGKLKINDLWYKKDDFILLKGVFNKRDWDK